MATQKVTGEFNVKLNPIEGYAKGVDGVNLGRMSIDKTFTGELDATSTGEMLSAMTATQGSAGYVAIEQVTGSLSGKKGSFVLQHYGQMNKGKDSLILQVVPDSASGELEGLTGDMAIRIEQGIHFYDFEYQL
ncbi:MULTISPECIES: DUF3224 domain-containing protein [Pseudoalteromonas]|uniref:DUF3224 domain-containing protein n=1 Tax=Pseudoalteromonas haloplanktis TaxID=228 RepID=A0ABU1BFP7_PSEHA|nr:MULTISPECIES: DUF3224 domain-containing protein [Pseudoalteromonas]MCF6144433.1 hypothetical protein [Pseudoalteromonas mariniglutinosa NCIMB 1770]MDQ9092566.1 DUF3224 domain-containing protein [Pseudoalteromonas haloplanktis]TMN70914.1 DUF3224 domain-containing protein [Pseudoalteromonas sp. S1727]BDF96245.1 hypothetical protein KAN5_30830 [Pseudoalteromonas sp. KAN5]